MHKNAVIWLIFNNQKLFKKLIRIKSDEMNVDQFSTTGVVPQIVDTGPDQQQGRASTDR